MQMSLTDLYSSYGICGLMRLLRDLFLTKMSFPQARLMRRPIYLRGKKWMRIGKRFTCGPGLRIDVIPQDHIDGLLLKIGDNVQVNDYVHIAVAKSVTVGNRVLIASKVFIADHDHGCYSGPGRQDNPLLPPVERKLNCSPVIIEDDVWIGEFVAVLSGVTIGKGSIIGAHSTVRENIPPHSIAVGSPARIVKKFDFKAGEWKRL